MVYTIATNIQVIPWPSVRRKMDCTCLKKIINWRLTKYLKRSSSRHTRACTHPPTTHTRNKNSKFHILVTILLHPYYCKSDNFMCEKKNVMFLHGSTRQMDPCSSVNIHLMRFSNSISFKFSAITIKFKANIILAI